MAEAAADDTLAFLDDVEQQLDDSLTEAGVTRRQHQHQHRVETNQGNDFGSFTRTTERADLQNPVSVHELIAMHINNIKTDFAIENHNFKEQWKNDIVQFRTEFRAEMQGLFRKELGSVYEEMRCMEEQFSRKLKSQAKLYETTVESIKTLARRVQSNSVQIRKLSLVVFGPEDSDEYESSVSVNRNDDAQKAPEKVIRNVDRPVESDDSAVNVKEFGSALQDVLNKFLGGGNSTCRAKAVKTECVSDATRESHSEASRPKLRKKRQPSKASSSHSIAVQTTSSSSEEDEVPVSRKLVRSQGTLPTKLIQPLQEYKGKESWSGYFKYFEESLILNNVAKDMRFSLLASCLRGDARSVLGDLEQGETSYKKLVKALRNRFGDENKEEMFRAQLDNLKQSSKSFQELASEVRRLVNRVFVHMDSEGKERENVRYFVRALSSEYIKEKVRDRRCKELDLAVAEADVAACYEDESKQKKIRSVVDNAGADVVKVADIKTIVQQMTQESKVKSDKPKQRGLNQLTKRQQGSFKRNADGKIDYSTVKCYNCNEFGHFASYCKQRSNSSQSSLRSPRNMRNNYRDKNTQSKQTISSPVRGSPIKVCQWCHMRGHVSSQCYELVGRPKINSNSDIVSGQAWSNGSYQQTPQMQQTQQFDNVLSGNGQRPSPM